MPSYIAPTHLWELESDWRLHLPPSTQRRPEHLQVLTTDWWSAPLAFYHSRVCRVWRRAIQNGLPLDEEARLHMERYHPRPWRMDDEAWRSLYHTSSVTFFDDVAEQPFVASVRAPLIHATSVSSASTVFTDAAPAASSRRYWSRKRGNTVGVLDAVGTRTNLSSSGRIQRDDGGAGGGGGGGGGEGEASQAPPLLSTQLVGIRKFLPVALAGESEAETPLDVEQRRAAEAAARRQREARLLLALVHDADPAPPPPDNMSAAETRDLMEEQLREIRAKFALAKPLVRVQMTDGRRRLYRAIVAQTTSASILPFYAQFGRPDLDEFDGYVASTDSLLTGTTMHEQAAAHAARISQYQLTAQAAVVAEPPAETLVQFERHMEVLDRVSQLTRVVERGGQSQRGPNRQRR